MLPRRYFGFALSLVLALPVSARAGEHFGTAASAKNADRTVVIKPGTESVTVKRGEIVTLVYMDRSFTWKFDTLGLPTMALREVAPKDFGVADVRVAVFPHPILDAGS